MSPGIRALCPVPTTTWTSPTLHTSTSSTAEGEKTASARLINVHNFFNQSSWVHLEMSKVREQGTLDDNKEVILSQLKSTSVKLKNLQSVSTRKQLNSQKAASRKDGPVSLMVVGGLPLENFARYFLPRICIYRFVFNFLQGLILFIGFILPN